MLSVLIHAPASAATLTETAPAADWNARILDREVELLKLNTRLRLQQVLPRSPWLGRRWCSYQLTNTALTATGALISGAGRFSYLHKSRIKRAPKDLFEHATWLRVGANADMVAGSMIESVMDGVADWKLRRAGMDLPTVRKCGERLCHNIDALLTERQQWLEAIDCSAEERRTLLAQGRVLSDLRDLSVQDFVDAFSEAKANRTVRHLQLGLAAATNTLSGTCSYIGGIYGSQQRRVTSRYRSRLGGTGGIGDVVAGSINLCGPLLVRAAGDAQRRRWQHTFNREFALRESTTVATLVKDGESLPAAPAGDTAVVSVASDIFRQREKARLAAPAAANRKLSQQMFLAGATAGTKVANGVGGLVGAFDYSAQAQPRFRVNGAVNLAYGAGYCLASVELIRAQLLREIHGARARREHSAPGQILSDQLARLEKLESKDGLAAAGQLQ